MPSPWHGARPRLVRVLCSQHLGAPDCHQRARGPFGRRGDVLGGEERRLLPSHLQESWAACPGQRSQPRTCALAGGSVPDAAVEAHLRMRGEEECAQTLDSNPGCNYLVAPLCIFFWRGDMPHYSPPLPFSAGRVGCPCMMASPPGAGVAVMHVRGHARWPTDMRLCPARGLRVAASRTHLAVTAPRFLPVCSPVLGETPPPLPSSRKLGGVPRPAVRGRNTGRNKPPGE